MEVFDPTDLARVQMKPWGFEVVLYYSIKP